MLLLWIALKLRNDKLDQSNLACRRELESDLLARQRLDNNLHERPLYRRRNKARSPLRVLGDQPVELAGPSNLSSVDLDSHHTARIEVEVVEAGDEVLDAKRLVAALGDGNLHDVDQPRGPEVLDADGDAKHLGWHRCVARSVLSSEKRKVRESHCPSELLYPSSDASCLAYNSVFDSGRTPVVMEDELPASLAACAVDVLTTADAFLKAEKSARYACAWLDGRLSAVSVSGATEAEAEAAPERPARPAGVAVVDPRRVKQGSRLAFVHGLVHAESYAVDLMWDSVARFAHLGLPRAFFDDWTRVAGEEAAHFGSWATRLQQLGGAYGDLPAHDGLWDSAMETRDSLLARLAVVHLVHEARGLDVFPKAEQRFARSGDAESLAILRKNFREETTHVAAGVRWFRFLCEQDGRDPVQTFHEIVPRYFHGLLKPPFNKAARDQAGLLEEWYIPLSTLAKGEADA